jgi:acetolactate synthase-1/2/3 large subunit
MVSKKKVSDIVADFLARKSVRHVFAISGGASLHLIHSIAANSSIDYICNHNEQASAMCADAYSRITGNIGVVIATSGPGATNLITGLCCSYYDSVPVLAITGQTSTTRMVGKTGVRQIGFQETPIVDICKTITKYAVQLTDPYRIIYELEKAHNIAKSGRPGPVIIDIPDDLQREYIDYSLCTEYLSTTVESFKQLPTLKDSEEYIISNLITAKRPIVIAGWGVRIASFEKQLIEFAEKLEIPIALTWGAADLIPYSHPLYVGTFGTHGQRHSNFAVQNADLVLSFGSRLDTKSTGSPISTFAREAVKIIIDIDEAELLKFSTFGLNINQVVQEDLRTTDLNAIIIKTLNNQMPAREPWRRKIRQWKYIYERIDTISRDISCDKQVNPYVFFDLLSSKISQPTNILLDTGCAVAWGMQMLKVVEGVRIYHDLNNSAMGWSLPAAIASALCQEEKQQICIVGDGSLMMTLHELAVIKKYNLPVKIFLFNNNGYSMIRQTQDQWLGSDYFASSVDGGLGFPEYELLANAFGINYYEVKSNIDLDATISEVLRSQCSVLCNIHISSNMKVIPQVKAGKPNEDQEPLLPRNLFHKEMLIKAVTDI